MTEKITISVIKADIGSYPEQANPSLHDGFIFEVHDDQGGKINRIRIMTTMLVAYIAGTSVSVLALTLLASFFESIDILSAVYLSDILAMISILFIGFASISFAVCAIMYANYLKHICLGKIGLMIDEERINRLFNAYYLGWISFYFGIVTILPYIWIM